MVDLVQKDMLTLWADTGDILQPDDTKISNGWDVELVPRQWWNWMQNRVDTNVAYLLQKGIPEWNSSIEYIINKSYVQYLGVVYKCIQTHTNQTPVVGAYWAKAFPEASASLEALRVLTPAANTLPYFTGATTAATTAITAFARGLLDDGNAETARTTLGAQAADATLEALAGLTTGPNKLAYFTGVDTAATTDLTAFGRSLIGDANAAAARTTLELVKQTSTTDETAGRLLTVGAFGQGSAAIDMGTTSLDTLSSEGSRLARVQTANVVACNAPSGASGGVVQHIYFSAANSAQIYTQVSTSQRQWIRYFASSTWAAWEEVLTGFNAGTAAYADLTTAYNDTTAGRVLKVADFGLGASNTTAITDCNTATISGFYTVSGSATNRPSGAGGSNGNLVVTVGGTTNRCTQYYSADSTAIPSVWVRNETSAGVFGGWYELFHEGNQLALGTTASAGRTALGLGTAATATLTTSATDTTAGRVLKVGDYGAGTVGIPSTNLDTVSVSGTYKAGSSATGIPAIATTLGYNVTYQGDSSFGTMIAYGYDSSRVFQRHRQSGTWSAWKEYFTDGNQLDLGTTAASGRTALGLGTAAVDNSSTGNTANNVVKRDASGNIACSVLTATDGNFSGAVISTGVVDASSAGTGKVGQVVTATRSTELAISANNAANCTSISLTAGDWEVHGLIQFHGTATSSTYHFASISLTSATIDADYTAGVVTPGTNTAVLNDQVNAPVRRVNVSATTTVYLVGQAGFSGGTQTIEGRIYARRIR